MGEQELKDLKDSIGDDVVNSLDIPDSFGEKPEKRGRLDPKIRAEEPEEEEEEEETEDDPEQESDDAEEEDEEGDEIGDEVDEVADEDEVIPRSKHESIIKKMENRINRMSSEVKQLEEKLSTKPADNDAKLEAMSESELQSVSNGIMLTIMDGEQDGRELTRQDKMELLSLNTKVQKLLSTAQQRFESKQVKHLEKLLPEIEEVYPDFKQQWQTRKGVLFETALNIYQRSQALRSNELGLAEAFSLAMGHLSNQTNSGERGKSVHLKKQVNRLKKKTSLQGRTLKPDMTKERGRKQWKKAVSGSSEDKAAWVYDNVLPQMR